jgi:hypothetical protein
MRVAESVTVIPILPVRIPPTVKALPHLALGDTHVNYFAFGNDDVKLRQPHISETGELGCALLGVKGQLEMLRAANFHIQHVTTA